MLTITNYQNSMALHPQCSDRSVCQLCRMSAMLSTVGEALPQSHVVVYACLREVALQHEKPSKNQGLCEYCTHLSKLKHC